MKHFDLDDIPANPSTAESLDQLLARLDAMDAAQYAARRVALQATAQASTVPAALAGVQ